jgi:endo-1,4-beta-mannosidase
MLEVTKKSMLSGKAHSMELDITQEQLDRWESVDKQLVQVAFPNLSSSEREFLMTGITPTEWNEEFGDEEDDHDE